MQAGFVGSKCIDRIFPVHSCYLHPVMTSDGPCGTEMSEAGHYSCIPGHMAPIHYCMPYRANSLLRVYPRRSLTRHNKRNTLPTQ